MLKGISNVKLLIILAGLVGVYLIIHFTGGKTQSKSFRSSLVEIDTAKVTKIEIAKEGKELKLEKVGDTNWNVTLESGKVVDAKATSIKSTLNNLTTLKPSRLASKDPAKWSDYQVDSTGTRVKIYEGSDKKLDIVLGKFDVQGQRSYHTFVRLAEDDEVYAADNFMSISFSADSENFREQTFIRTKRDSVMSISFNYPDTAFALTRNNSGWAIDGVATDSTTAAQFVSGLGYSTSKGFVDNIETFGTPVLTMEVIQAGSDDITIQGYEVPGRENLVLNSSINEDSYFDDDALITKFLKGKSYFLKP
ncbi:MAG: DUF4340 domain-containing protein [Cyclobacteriaceae bacterium]